MGIILLLLKCEQTGIIDNFANASCDLLAVPYSTWANREVGPMSVWLASTIPSAPVAGGK